MYWTLHPVSHLYITSTIILVLSLFSRVNAHYGQSEVKGRGLSDGVVSLVNSLDLPSDRARTVLAKLKAGTKLMTSSPGSTNNAQAAASLACDVVQSAIGASEVDTSPVNQTLVEINWSVVFSRLAEGD